MRTTVYIYYCNKCARRGEFVLVIVVTATMSTPAAIDDPRVIAQSVRVFLNFNSF